MTSDLPPGWAQVTIGDVCRTVAKTDPRNLPDVSFKYIDIGGIQPGSGRIRETKTLMGVDAPSRARQIVRAGDIVLSTVRTYQRKTAIVPDGLDGAIASTGFAVLRPYPGIDPRFVLFQTLSREFVERLNAKQTGTSYPAVRDKDVRSASIRIAPSSEQERIVAAIEERFSRLDAAEASVVTAQSKLLNLKAVLAKTAVRDWPTVQLGDIADVFVGSTPSRKQPALWGGPVPWVSSGEIQFCRIGQTRESLATTAVRPDRIHPPGTVLLGMIGEGRTRGQAAVLEVAAAHNQNSAAIRTLPSKLEPDWLFYVLSAQYESNRRIGSGNNQPALNKARVQALRIPVPPLSEQRRLVEQLDEATVALGQLHSGLGGAQQRCAVLRRAVLSEAFSGRLVPQNPDDEPASELLQRIATSRTAEPKRPKV